MGTNLNNSKRGALQPTFDHIDSSILVVEKDIESEKDVDNDRISMSEEEFAVHEKSLAKKLDLTLVPVVWLLYLFNYLDRNNIA
ncbi:major facilitator superfamily transporter [Colletotrichum tofieldiae]|nr:major facilitator superfamily transporter [Colletotrichum tofieldiae]GKT74930.1 major facilitator superfamily transporter [Colletotrichum tofieldiae]GKT92141.1 major facilitator superfamily transporter [Colletotrichum tofieldiae]